MPKKTQARHRADNHYFITIDRLRELEACRGGVDAFVKAAEAFNDGLEADTPVPINLELLTSTDDLTERLPWAVAWMEGSGKVTPEEARAFENKYYRTVNREVEARAFMDLLESRAIREGRLPRRRK